MYIFLLPVNILFATKNPHKKNNCFKILKHELKYLLTFSAVVSDRLISGLVD